MWYAVIRNEFDNDLGYGSHNFEEAKEMCRQMGKTASIVVIDEFDNPVETITQDQF